MRREATMWFLHWTRADQDDLALIRDWDGMILQTGGGFLNKNWEGQYLETLRDFCRQEGISLSATRPDAGVNLPDGQPPVERQSWARPVRDPRS